MDKETWILRNDVIFSLLLSYYVVQMEFKPMFVWLKRKQQTSVSLVSQYEIFMFV